MINHARTLLANLPMLTEPELGGEYIPRDYRPRAQPLPLLRIRELLFGSNPDRTFVNQRLWHYLTVLHSTELAEFVTALDPRITYLPLADAGWFTDRCKVTYSQAGPQGRVFLGGKLAADNAVGKSLFRWRVAVQDATTVTVRRRLGPFQEQELTVAAPSGLSEPILLPDSGLTLRLGVKQGGDGDLSQLVGSVVYVDGVARAETDLPAIALRLMTLVTADSGGALFGSAEPYKTFRNLWLTHPHLPYRLGGLLLAFIYRMNELRVRA
jgi:hypothetical protein